MRVSQMTRRMKQDSGAQALEFALIAPALLFMLFGAIYALLVVAAHVTLAHAASTAVRYAAVPTDNIEPVYPASGQVSAKLFALTPFFEPDDCATSLSGASVPNSQVNLSVSCSLVNPLADVLNGIRALFPGAEGGPFAGTFTVSAQATGRRE